MRLIDADALVNQIRQEPTDGMYTEEILEIIGNAPTIEAAPVVHGRWGEYEPFRGWPCTACGEYGTDKGKKPSSRFCPNCGARMDGDADG